VVSPDFRSSQFILVPAADLLPRSRHSLHETWQSALLARILPRLIAQMCFAPGLIPDFQRSLTEALLLDDFPLFAPGEDGRPAYSIDSSHFEYVCKSIAASDQSADLLFDLRPRLNSLSGEISDAEENSDESAISPSIRALTQSVRQSMAISLRRILVTPPRGGTSRSRSSHATTSSRRTPRSHTASSHRARRSQPSRHESHESIPPMVLLTPLLAPSASVDSELTPPRLPPQPASRTFRVEPVTDADGADISQSRSLPNPVRRALPRPPVSLSVRSLTQQSCITPSAPASTRQHPVPPSDRALTRQPPASLRQPPVPLSTSASIRQPTVPLLPLRFDSVLSRCLLPLRPDCLPSRRLHAPQPGSLLPRRPLRPDRVLFHRLIAVQLGSLLSRRLLDSSCCSRLSVSSSAPTSAHRNVSQASPVCFTRPPGMVTPKPRC
jgi:hypothetical protein